jgi:hypothetical protein
MPLYFAIRVELLQLKENSHQQTPLCIPLPVEPRDTASFYITLPHTASIAQFMEETKNDFLLNAIVLCDQSRAAAA